MYAWLPVYIYTRVYTFRIMLTGFLCATCYKRPPALSDHFCCAGGEVAQDRFTVIEHRQVVVIWVWLTIHRLYAGLLSCPLRKHHQILALTTVRS